MDKKFKVSLYIRVSTGKQAEGDSLEEQEKELKKFCEYKGYLIHRSHIESGRSAKDTNRPEYQRLLKDIQAGKINAVVVKKLDRLSRSLLDFESFMVTAQEHNVEFISLKENFDTTTAMGKAMLRVALVFAQLEREQTAERISDVMVYRAEQGLRNGGVTPYGYDCINKELVPHRQHKKVIELLFDKFIETKSTVEVAKFLNEAGYRNRSGKLWDCRRIYKILHNETYIGKLLWGGKSHQGIHQPLISEKKFVQVQHIFQSQDYISTKRSTGAILQKLLICGDCHAPMSPSHSLNRQKQKYFYYRCTSTNNNGKGRGICKFRQTSFKSIESRVTELLFSLVRAERFKAIENQILKHNLTIEREEQKIKADIILMESKMENIIDKKDRYLDSLISSQFLSTERQKINAKLEDLELKEKQVKANIYKLQFELNQTADDKIDLIEFKQMLISFKKDYETLSREQLRKQLSTIIKEITYYPDKLAVHFRLLPWSLEFEV